MKAPFSKIKGNFGFGMMRLPMLEEGKVDIQEVCRMADAFMEAGFNYFDTAHGYLGGLSEKAVKEAISSRYDREDYVLTNKMTSEYFTTNKEAREYFERQLKTCGVDYFDFYLIHSVNAENLPRFKECDCFNLAFELKEKGFVKHVGMSFHDSAELLEEILIENPNLECIQLQVNYLDYESDVIQAKKCLEVCKKYNKPVIVMEPIKGGMLIRLPGEAKKILESSCEKSPAGLALRFAAGCEGVYMTLSGMSSISDMEDNISHMKDFKPLNDEEMKEIDEILSIFSNMSIIECTGCRYCVEGCPMKIDIPSLFSCVNTKNLEDGWNVDYYYEKCIFGKGKARDCIECGACEKICPQHLPIREYLKKTAKMFKEQEEGEA